MKRIITIIVLALLSTGGIILSFIAPFYKLWSIVFASCLSLSFLFILFSYFFKEKFYRLAITINIFVICIVLLFVLFYYTGILSHFTSLEEAREYFQSFGVWAWAIFFLIQIAQVVILPIPAQITTIAGVLIFGATIAFIISSLATIIGSIICFSIGRIIGVKILYKLASKQTIDKYRKLLTDKGKVLLPVMFLFPCFPDDLLCFIAGTTKLTWLYFLITTLTTRLVGVACICWLGSGDLIPFSGWGIPVWIVLGIFMIITIFLLFKYQEKIETWVINTFNKKKKNE